MPPWLINLIVEMVLKYLVNRFGMGATVEHLSRVLEKYGRPEPHLTQRQMQNPNFSNPPERGGIP